jgi:hypothetical protein
MQVCIFYQKNCNSIVQGLVVVAGWLQYFLFFILLFLIFLIFLFSKNQFFGAGHGVTRPCKSFSWAGALPTPKNRILAARTRYGYCTHPYKSF